MDRHIAYYQRKVAEWKESGYSTKHYIQLMNYKAVLDHRMEESK